MRLIPWRLHRWIPRWCYNVLWTGFADPVEIEADTSEFNLVDGELTHSFRFHLRRNP